MKRFISLMVLVLTVVNLFSVQSQANINLSDFDSYTVVRVLEIIDGEVFKVQYGTSPNEREEIIRLIGVDAEGNQDAYDFAYSNLMGKLVILTRDDNIPRDSNNWEQVYLYSEFSKSYNLQLLEKGYAKLNINHSKSELYSTFTKAENYAKSLNFGVWNADGSIAGLGNRVNINTATYTQLYTLLEDTTAGMASRIVLYRKTNPFNTIEEVKFADPLLDHEWFEKNKDKISVVTNLTLATDYELQTLFPTASAATIREMRNALSSYLTFNTISSIDEIKKIDEIKNVYEDFSDFITIDNHFHYENRFDYKTVNINIASAEEIKVAADLTTSAANRIYEARDKGYTFKNVSEVLQFQTGLTSDQLLRIKDNFTTITNINTATRSELSSLFSTLSLSNTAKNSIADSIINRRPFYDIKDLKSFLAADYYNLIEPYITVSDTTNYYNINTTDKDFLISLFKLNNSDAQTFKSRDVIYKNHNSFNFEFEHFEHLFSFYTDINTASRDVLYRLDKDMSYGLVDEIIKFRSEQPITSLSEVHYLFEKSDSIEAYNRIKNYIVFY
jgi:DNA uptake protein ComE-like DNA-binding protein